MAYNWHLVLIKALQFAQQFSENNLMGTLQTILNTSNVHGRIIYLQ